MDGETSPFTQSREFPHLITCLCYVSCLPLLYVATLTSIAVPLAVSFSNTIVRCPLCKSRRAGKRDLLLFDTHYFRHGNATSYIRWLYTPGTHSTYGFGICKMPISNYCTKCLGSPDIKHDRTPDCKPVFWAWMQG